MRTRIRSWPSAGAAGKRKSGPRARSTNSRPSKQLPASRLLPGVRPARRIRRQRTATPILATPPRPRSLSRPSPCPRSPRHTAAADPSPPRRVSPAPFSRRHGVPRPPTTVAQRPLDEPWWGVSAAKVGFSVAEWGDRASCEACWRLGGDRFRRDPFVRHADLYIATFGVNIRICRMGSEQVVLGCRQPRG